ncbi:hypothetical protein GCM10011512_06150 [Tersicoccus solisilvae]|uniref:Maltokinase N-terminal cap domain-containing protein n=1 Tax=Tersicoccus solisilvae TaxID=1882339 RepID=A0ABQ1NX30_9MICC|nr:hypothetical protein [Tersicoccus solisilvae]GGC82192.1 hypothetical protein GCM10011512_06150 [Tersicoccus solisilvae]
MALIYDADLKPGKLDVVAQWLPLQTWYDGDEVPELTRVASYRFDDPDGEVGIETLLVSTGDGPVLQVPLTYRAEPLPEHGPASLIATMEHSVLGTRYVYDATGDPVYVRALAAAILHGTGQAEQVMDGETTPLEPTIDVRSEGSLPGHSAAETDAAAATLDVESAEIAGETTVVDAGVLTLTVQHVLDEIADAEVTAGQARLLGSWPGHDEPVVLAALA